MSDPTLIAADPRRSAWVAANAGAGKTYTLAARVTRLLLAGAAPEKILCLTYTKAAAAEMAGRLFAQLGEWAMLPDGELRTRIETIGGAAGDDDTLRRARRLFAGALETPGGLKIQTIHAFCQRVLTRFPIEAGIPAAFRVLDERSARECLAEARAVVFERAGAGNHTLAGAVATLAAQMSDEAIAQLLDAALSADRGRLDTVFETLGDSGGDWSTHLRAAHGAKPGDNEKTVLAELSRAVEADREPLRRIAAALAQGSKTDQERAALIGAALETGSDKERYDRLVQALLTKDGDIRAKLATKKAVEAYPAVQAELSAYGERLLELNQRLRALNAATLCEAALVLIDAVRDVYASRKRALGMLDYDDLIDRTEALLKRGTPWVMYKLDQGIDHILIDEAQDTSARQWDIVESLTEEFFDGMSAKTGRTLFAVGDEKQSIFSFQGADPAQFDIRRRFFAERARASGAAFTVVDLPVSRRSAPEILAFVDKTFESDEARAGLTSTGVPLRHEPLRFDLSGRVDFWPTFKPDDTDDADPWEVCPLDAMREHSPPGRLAARIADTIAGWLRSGATLPGAEHPIRPGDIMILLPRREPFGGEIIRRLKERDVPVAGADRLKLTEHIAVMDLIALGRFALTPDDDLTLAALLRSPLVGLDEDELFALAHGRSRGLWRELRARGDETPAFARARDILHAARSRADTVPPFEFFAATLRDGRRAMLRRLGPETNDAIEEFLSLALTYEAEATPSLEGFLHWIGRGGAEVKRDMDRGRGEVRVMTVHGAKGLEADIVFLPDTTALPTGRGARGHLLYTDKDALFPLANAEAPPPVLEAKRIAEEAALAEHRRLLYVALTRAKRRLILCGFETKRGRKAKSWHDLAERAATAMANDAPPDRPIVIGGGGEIPAAPESDIATPVEIPPWALHPPAQEVPRPKLIRPSEAAGIDEPAPASPFAANDGAMRGRLVHALLARLPELAPETRRTAAATYLQAHGVPPDLAEDMIAKTVAIIDDARFAEAFRPTARAEVALAADLPEFGQAARLHGRIDRMVIGTDAILIVDFKTNRRPPEKVDDVPTYYAAQMALYRLAAGKIFPNRRIACALLWTEIPLLMPLPEEFLDAQTKRIAARLTEAGTVPK